jgi:hypothetical protein
MAAFARRLLLALAGLLAATPAPAVLIASGDGTGNTSAPPSDPGWSHVGTLNYLTGVYLGDGWVLTASHVGTGAIHLGGTSFPPVTYSTVVLEHAPGAPTDLRMFRLVSDPGLTTLPVAAASPAVGTQAVMIGYGRNRGAPYTFSGRSGWYWAASKAMRWGTNAVSQASFDLSLSGQLLRSLGLAFDNLGGSAPEAIGTNGDSGGAAFVDGSLAGILVAVWSYGGQASGTSVFGNGTYVADLSYYRDQILLVAGERACSDELDDDGDGLTDLADPGCYGPDDPFETNALIGCDDGFDGDGDGLVDWPEDPGCNTAIALVEDPACDDGLDNDGDGYVDWDGGGGGSSADPQCVNKPWRASEAASGGGGGCGLGFELVFLAPVLSRLGRRRRA